MFEHALVFCDVDDTLIHTKSLFAFFSIMVEGVELREQVGLRERWQRLLVALDAKAAREELNRCFYSEILCGMRVSRAAELARAWFECKRIEPGFLCGPVVDFVARQRGMGAEVVLVSGSFPELIEPIAEFVGASTVLCSRPRVTGGIYSTELAKGPMIGNAKAEAVRLFLAERGVDRAACCAIGDDMSDVPMLRAAGRGYVPAHADGEVMAVAAREGWSVL